MKELFSSQHEFYIIVMEDELKNQDYIITSLLLVFTIYLQPPGKQNSLSMYLIRGDDGGAEIGFGKQWSGPKHLASISLHLYISVHGCRLCYDNTCQMKGVA